MDSDSDIAVDALSRAIEALLRLGLALDVLDAVEVPVDALDTALREDDAYLEARSDLRQVVEELRVLAGDDMCLRFEASANAHAVASTDVGFRLGMAMATRKPS